MARRCEICGKGRMTGNRVSHSNIKTKRVSYPNLQRIRMLKNGRVVRGTVCTRCIRSGKVVKAI